MPRADWSGTRLVYDDMTVRPGDWLGTDYTSHDDCERRRTWDRDCCPDCGVRGCIVHKPGWL